MDSPTGAHQGLASQPSEPRFHTNGQVYPLHATQAAPCSGEVEVVIFKFMSFGRLAHVRRSLQSIGAVRGVRITGYGDQTAFFSVTVAPSTPASSLVVPGTRLLSSNGSRVELSVEAW